MVANRRRLLAVLAAFMLLLVGCGQAAETEPDTAPAGDSDAEQVEPDTGDGDDGQDDADDDDDGQGDDRDD
jgi:hypothetical protein